MDSALVTKRAESFSVTSVMREPLYVVERFVNHYLSIGAERIVILWDGLPDETMRSDLRTIATEDKLTYYFCDDKFWKKAGLDQSSMALDDILNAGFKFSYSNCETSWMLFCDSDEFLYFPNNIPKFLGRIPPDVASLRVRNLEAVWGPEDDISRPFGSSYFRAPIEIPYLTKIICTLLLGRYARLSRGGAMGHFQGKHFLRNGLKDVEITSHQSRKIAKGSTTWAHMQPEPGSKMFVAHYDAISEERWVEKWRRRISKERISDEMHWRRSSQGEMVAAAIRRGTTHELFARLYGISRFQAWALRKMGLLTKVEVLTDNFSQYPKASKSEL